MLESNSIEQQGVLELVARVTVINQGENVPASRGIDKIELYNIIAGLLKGMVWPILLLFFFSEFRVPILKIADQLPDKFSRASKVSLGNVTLEIIQEKARETGSLAIAEKLGKLSPRAVEALFNVSKNTVRRLVGNDSREGQIYYSLPGEAEMKALFELQQRGFLEFSENYPDFLKLLAQLHLQEDLAEEGDSRIFKPVQPLSPDQEQSLYKQSYQLTKEGEEALDVVIEAVAEQLSKREQGEADFSGGNGAAGK